jgi:hypothetical protein
VLEARVPGAEVVDGDPTPLRLGRLDEAGDFVVTLDALGLEELEGDTMPPSSVRSLTRPSYLPILPLALSRMGWNRGNRASAFRASRRMPTQRRLFA